MRISLAIRKKECEISVTRKWCGVQLQGLANAHLGWNRSEPTAHLLFGKLGRVHRLSWVSLADQSMEHPFFVDLILNHLDSGHSVYLLMIKQQDSVFASLRLPIGRSSVCSTKYQITIRCTLFVLNFSHSNRYAKPHLHRYSTVFDLFVLSKRLKANCSYYLLLDLVDSILDYFQLI